MSRPRARSRKIFVAANGDGPWSCDFCPMPVVALNRHDGFVHHRDHDKWNDEPENLGAAHPRCHTLHHVGGKPGPNLGKVMSEESKSKISMSLSGRKLSPEVRANMSAARQRDREKIRARSVAAWSEGRGRNQHTGGSHGD